MKKLITMMAAAALGAFAWADTDFDGTGSLTYTVSSDFEDGVTNIVGYADNAQTSVFNSGDVYWWATNYPTASAEKETYEQPIEVATETINNESKKVFKIETDAATPLLRTFNKTIGTETPTGSDVYTFDRAKQPIDDNGLFADSMIKLSASEEPPSTCNGKIAVWLQVIPAEDPSDENTEGIAGSTNLMVTCGVVDTLYNVSGTTNIVISAGAEIVPDTWHRVTIRTIKTINKYCEVPGFVIWVDGVLATAAAGAYELPTVDGKGARFNALNALFASASSDSGEARTLDSVGFAGSGALQKIDLTDMLHAPSFAQDPTKVRFVFDANVASITINNTDIIVDAQNDYVDFEITDFENATVATIEYKAGYRGKSVAKTDNFFDSFSVSDDKKTATFMVTRFTDGGIVTIDSELDRQEATVTVNDVAISVSVAGSYLSSVLAYVNANCDENDNVKITLGDSATLSAIELTSASNLSKFTGKIEIDLHGCTIQSALETITLGDVAMFQTSGTVTFSDSVGGGKIIAQTGLWAIINMGSLTLNPVSNGNDITYIGDVHNDLMPEEDKGQWTVYATISILGGKFSVKPTTDVEGHLDDGITLGDPAGSLKWVDPETTGGDYWTLETTESSVTVTGDAGVDIVITTNNEQVVTSPVKIIDGMDLTVVATLKPGYKFVNTTVDGWTYAEAGGTMTYTTNDVSIVESFTITVPATEKIPVTLTLTAGDNTTLTANKVAPYVYGDEITVTAAPVAGYEFAADACEGWEKDSANLVSNFVITANTTITGPAATQIKYAVTVADDIQNGSVTTSADGKVAPGTTVTLTVTPNAGYQIASVTTNGQALAAVENVYSFVMPAENVEVGATFAVKTDCKVTFKTGDGTAFADQTYTFGTPFNLNKYEGTCTGYDFGGWTNNAAGGPIIANEAQLAADVESYTLTAVWNAQQGGEWSDIEQGNISDVSDENKAAVEATLAAIKTALGTDKTAQDVATFLNAVYGNTKVPAATVAGAKNIDISVKYSLPLMTADQPTVQLAAASEVSEGNVAAFTFKIMDGENAVNLKPAETAKKVLSMIQYCETLGVWAGATAEDVAVTVDETDTTLATAQLIKKTEVNAGFMKVELTAE